MKMTRCLKNDYEEGCSLDRKQKTSKKEKLKVKKNGFYLFILLGTILCENLI